jgi:hypothetical protein
MFATDCRTRKRRSEHMVVKPRYNKVMQQYANVSRIRISWPHSSAILWNVKQMERRIERSATKWTCEKLYGSVVNIDTHTKGSHWVGLILDCRNLKNGLIFYDSVGNVPQEPRIFSKAVDPSSQAKRWNILRIVLSTQNSIRPVEPNVGCMHPVHGCHGTRANIRRLLCGRSSWYGSVWKGCCFFRPETSVCIHAQAHETLRYLSTDAS